MGEGGTVGGVGNQPAWGRVVGRWWQAAGAGGVRQGVVGSAAAKVVVGQYVRWA